MYSLNNVEWMSDWLLIQNEFEDHREDIDSETVSILCDIIDDVKNEQSAEAIEKLNILSNVYSIGRN